MKFSLTLTQKGFVLIGVPLICELVFVGTLAALVHQSDAELAKVWHAERVIALTDRIVRNGFLGAEVVQRFNMDGRPKGSGKKLAELIVESRKQFAALEKEVDGYPDEQFMVDSAKTMNAQIEETVYQASHIIRGGSIIEGIQKLKDMDKFKPLTNRLIADLHAIVDAEQKVADGLPELQADTRRRWETALTLGVAFNVLLAFWLAIYFSRGTTDRLRILMDNTRRLARGEPLHKPVGGGDEIAVLDRFFNDMASALNSARESERQMIQMKEQFIAMVSHDLRTPLMSISACLSLLEAGALGQLTEDGQESVRTAEDSATRLMALVNDVLDAQRLEAGKLPMDPAPVMLSAIVQRAFDSVRAVADREGIGLESDVSDCQFVADGDRLVQVVVNLVSNALKFSPAGSAVIVHAGKQEDEIELRVEDKGRGIPAEMQEKIFERFQQMEANDGKRLRGSGLGLAICKAIVERHGGKMGVESVPGSGSTFWFRIPAGGPPASLTASVPALEAHTL